MVAYSLIAWLTAATMLANEPAADSNEKRPRARDLGIVIGSTQTGPLNAITDVGDVRVGHTTLVEGDSIRTGVTVIMPHGGNLFQEKVPAALAVANGFGKLVGATQIVELGRIESPIALTNTMSAFAVADALVAYTSEQPGNERVESVNPVVGECNDGYLNDIRGRHVRGEHVFEAIRAARGGEVAEGSVGGGTGVRCMGFKGGIGTSSRRLTPSQGGYTVGVLVQTNYSGTLVIDGAPVGRDMIEWIQSSAGAPANENPRAVEPKSAKEAAGERPPGDGGSCMIVVATDAPLDARQLGRLARRAVLGLAATGTSIAHGSGDYVIAFSTDPALRMQHESKQATEQVTLLRDDRLNPLFAATRDATEEAIVNGMLRATTVVGREGHRSVAIPIDRVLWSLRRHATIPRPVPPPAKND